MFKGLGILLASGALALVGCDYNNDGPAEPDATVPARSSGDGGGSAPVIALDGGLRDAQVDARALDAGDAGSNESFESALEIAPGDGLLQDIHHGGQTNYFVFQAASAGFYELHTNYGDFSPDVAMSLYDAARTKLASNDNGSLWPGDAIDARLVVHLNKPGRYFVEIVDQSSSSDDFAPGQFALSYYRLDLRALTAGSPGVAFLTPDMSPVQFVQDISSGYGYVTAVGTMLPATVDSFLIEGQKSQALISHVLPAGVSGNGSSASVGPVRVRNVDAGTLLAEVDGTPGHLALFPPIGEGRYELSVTAPAVLGDNAFYAVDLVVLPDNPREQAEQGNVGLAGAEPIMFQGTTQRRGLLLTDVSGGDVDYYSFTATAGATALVSCEGESEGSGVRELTVELRDAADQRLTTAVESATHDLAISSFTLPTAGMYFLRFASAHVATGKEAEPWLRCVVFISQ